MRNHTFRYGVLVEALIPYFLGALAVWLKLCGCFSLASQRSDQLTIMAASLTVGSILFGFSGIIIVTISTIANSKIIKWLSISGHLKVFYALAGESLLINSIFVGLCTVGLLRTPVSAAFELVWLFFMAVAFLKFCFSVFMLFLIVWAQILDASNPAKPTRSNDTVDADKFK